MISIICATDNAEKVLARLLQSIIEQKSENLELIVIDGNSNDNTIQIIQQYRDYIDYFISEKDKGIYDAWNKGIKVCKGDWIMFLGADDVLLPTAISDYFTFLKELEGRDIRYISSKVQMIDSEEKDIWINGWKWQWPKFLFKMTVAHPGSLHSRELFSEFGLYDLRYKIVGDYEFLLRPGKKLRYAFLNKVTVKMTEGGMSDSYAAIREHYFAATRTGAGAKPLVFAGCLYVLLKSKLNKLGRKVGLKLNLDRA